MADNESACQCLEPEAAPVAETDQAERPKDENKAATTAKSATAEAAKKADEPEAEGVKHDFLSRIARLINSGQTRTVVLTGNVNDLFFDGQQPGEYLPLVDLIKRAWRPSKRILVTYELNGPIRIANAADRTALRGAWIRFGGGDPDTVQPHRPRDSAATAAQVAAKLAEDFDQRIAETAGQPTKALEMLRQLCACSRYRLPDGRPSLGQDVVIVVEGADLVIPQGDPSRMSEADRYRAAVCRDWFSDPGFMNGGDTVILIAESREQLNDRVSKLPPVLEVTIPAPDAAKRRHCIDWFSRQAPTGNVENAERLAAWTAGLTNHALLQLLKGAAHNGGKLDQQEVVAKVESFIKSQLGEDVVDFKQPTHRLNQLVGNRDLLAFVRDELMPRFRSDGDDAWSGAIVAGPLGSGKTYIFEAVATELGMPVLVIKNLRSKWFGETDVILGRLRRTLEALSKALILFDEADTAFADVSGEQHSTEKRLVGALFQMMSDPKLKGKIIWLLMTARVHLLPADMMRPGRVGDLVIPILDPEGEDHLDFLAWAIHGAVEHPNTNGAWARLAKATSGYSAAQFALLRKELAAAKAKNGGRLQSTDQALVVMDEILPPSIDATRDFQAAQAVLHCTRKSLLPQRYRSEKARRKLKKRLDGGESTGLWAWLKSLFS